MLLLNVFRSRYLLLLLPSCFAKGSHLFKQNIDFPITHVRAPLVTQLFHKMPSVPTVKIAIIGTGLIGPRHAEAVLKVPGAELACIVDPNPAARDTAARFGCPIYQSVQAMLASVKPDAALVCTPNHTHVAVSMELLEGSVHVLCEKPISVDVASGQELVF
jgi:threonine dehydrogenase-like Zn-dependent dehydrogenase